MKTESSSFRDPSGFIFRDEEGVLLRQVNLIYKEDYLCLIQSGLYNELAEEGLLIPHSEHSVENSPDPSRCFKIIAPQEVPFISYPYEWCFGQLKDAALLTLKIQKKALAKGMCLKDASAFNVQFIGSRPVFIDTLSFEKYQDGAPWVAYRQFCQHFLAPLSLVSYRDPSLAKMTRILLDGVPIGLASKLLPRSTYFKFSLLSHIHAHAKTQAIYKGKGRPNYKNKLSKRNLFILIDSLERAIMSLKWEPSGTEWSDYYDNTNYSKEAFKSKEGAIGSMIEKYHPRTLWDLGANEGIFSRIACSKRVYTISLDADYAAVEQNYRKSRVEVNKYLLPLVMDVSNPSPDLGWNLYERAGLKARGPVDMVLAVALIHHLAIGGNASFDTIASFLKDVGKSVVIEFVPKSDSQVIRLLASRKDVFYDYTQENFEKVFGKYFIIKEKISLKDSKRTLYLLALKT